MMSAGVIKLRTDWYSMRHNKKIDEWVKEATPGLTTLQLIDLFGQVIARLWQLARESISGVTLSVIFERVLLNSTEKYPELAPLKIRETGVYFDALRKEFHALNR